MSKNNLKSTNICIYIYECLVMIMIIIRIIRIISILIVIVKEMISYENHMKITTQKNHDKSDT